MSQGATTGSGVCGASGGGRRESPGTAVKCSSPGWATLEEFTQFAYELVLAAGARRNTAMGLDVTSFTWTSL